MTEPFPRFREVNVLTSSDCKAVADATDHNSTGTITNVLTINALGDIVDSFIFYMTPWEWGFLGD